MTIASFGKDGYRHAFLEAARARGCVTNLVVQRGSYDFRVVGRMRTLLHALRPDVAVGHDYKADLVLRRACAAELVPWVAVVHGYTAENKKIRLFEALDRRAIRYASAVVTVSEAGREQVLAAGVPAARVHLVPNGIDVDAVRAEAGRARAALRAEWGLADGDLAVLTLGRLSPEKGQRVLLEAFARLKPEEAARARLFVVGDGAERAALETLAQSTGADGRVTFLGWRTDPHRCLGAADLFVLPSLREGLPLALLEAMAVGLPIVATAVGGVPEALDHGEAGLLVPPSDPTALAEALRTLAAGETQRRRLGQAAEARVRAAYGAAAQAEALSTIYRAVARSGPAMRAV
jgi:glycosyltransferase involved in cell wall biosynthesis